MFDKRNIYSNIYVYIYVFIYVFKIHMFTYNLIVRPSSFKV